jgi:mannose/fructose/N-acetylgalactosamine-specific phosphotransferase system component IIC
MGSPLVNTVNCALSWLIVALSAVGYALTLRRMKERWALWPVLGLGWGILAISNTLLVAGVDVSGPQLIAVLLASYVFVATSLLLLFLKAIALKGSSHRAQTVQKRLV